MINFLRAQRDVQNIVVEQPNRLFRKMNTSVAETEEAKAPNKAVFARWREFIGAYRNLCIAPTPEFRKLLDEFRYRNLDK